MGLQPLKTPLSIMIRHVKDPFFAVESPRERDKGEVHLYHDTWARLLREREARHGTIKQRNPNEYSDRGFRINTKPNEPLDYDAV
jgi:hypothetical protein